MTDIVTRTILETTCQEDNTNRKYPDQVFLSLENGVLTITKQVFDSYWYRDTDSMKLSENLVGKIVDFMDTVKR